MCQDISQSEKDQAGRDTPASSVPSHDHHPTVLIAEDSEDARLMLKYLLEMSGYRVLEAANGLEAVRAARHFKPDLILMDLSMPLLDGLTATIRIREYADLRHVPILAVSGYDTSHHRDGALSAGCDEFITKPVDSDKLEELLARLLNKR